MESPQVSDLEQLVSNLIRVVTHLDTLYDAGDDCVHPDTGILVTDSEYDRYRKELETSWSQLEKVSPGSPVLQTDFLQRLSASTLNDKDAGTVTHHPPMTSLHRCIGTLPERKAELEKFFDDIRTELGYTDGPEKWAVQAYKRDGVAVSIYYRKGRLWRAGLRPRNGVDGEDVTENIRFVEGVPEELWIHDRQGNRVSLLEVDLCIRGELECFKSRFEAFNKTSAKQYANTRNFASGSIRQFKDPSITKERNLSFVAYRIVGYDQAPYKTEIEAAKWCNRVLRVPHVRVESFSYDDLLKLENLSPSLDYCVDGIVISVDNLEDSDQMGTHGNSPTGKPRGKIAWKFEDEWVDVKVSDYHYSPGRTGVLTPVIEFPSVHLEGTVVSRCTGHSYGFMKGLSKASLGEIGRDAVIRIIKSGKIIPKPIEIIKPGQPHEMPHECPSCNGSLVVENGKSGAELVCKNEYCGVRAAASLTHYLSTVGAKGLAESTITRLYEAGLVKRPSDFYKLTFKQLTENKLLTERQATLALACIWLIKSPEKKKSDQLLKLVDQQMQQKLPVSAGKFLASLGIPGAGKSAGREMVNHFKDFRKIISASAQELEDVPDIGDITAGAIAEYFQEYKDMIEDLLQYIEPKLPKKGKFTGLSFVFTGTFSGGKETWQQAVEECGGVCKNSVSKNTDYVVVGTDAGSKEAKADQYGICKLSLADLQKMLGNN